MAIRLFAIILILDLCISSWCKGQELPRHEDCCGSVTAGRQGSLDRIVQGSLDRIVQASLDRIVIVPDSAMLPMAEDPTWIVSPSAGAVQTASGPTRPQVASRQVAAAVMEVTPLFRDADPWMDGWIARVQLLDAEGRPATPGSPRVRGDFRLIRDSAIDQTGKRGGTSRHSSLPRDDSAPRWSKTLSVDESGFARVELVTRSGDRTWLGLDRHRSGRHRSVFLGRSAGWGLGTSSDRTVAERFGGRRFRGVHGWVDRGLEPPSAIVAIGDHGAVVERPPMWGGMHGRVHVPGRGSFETVATTLLREAVLVDTKGHHP